MISVRKWGEKQAYLGTQGPGGWKTARDPLGSSCPGLAKKKAIGPPESSKPRKVEDSHKPIWVLTTQPGGRQPQACSHYLGWMKTDTGPPGSSFPRLDENRQRNTWILKTRNN